MARKSIYKTPLGHRLAEVRKQFSKERGAFAIELGISAAALSNYERGDNVPDANVLAAFREKFGVSLVWLIADIGGMFEDDAKAPVAHQPVDPALVERIYKLVEKAYRDGGRRQPGHRIAHEAGMLYNALLGAVKDVRDTAIVEAVLPVLTKTLQERLDDTKKKPRSGKRSTSEF